MEETKINYINTLSNVDCLSKEGLPSLPNESVDMILVDLPYGVTKASHDIALPLTDYVEILYRGKKKPFTEEEYYLHSFQKGELTFQEAKKYFQEHKQSGLMSELFRVVKERGAVVLFGQDKFSVDLINSARKYHRYNLIWNKVRSTGFLNAKRQPLRVHEDILVFYKKPPVYNPQKVKGKQNHSRGFGTGPNTNNNYGEFKFVDNKDDLGDLKYPTSIITFSKPHPPIFATQKSTELCEWLIKTYTDEHEIVLDCCAGSATTLIAAKNIGRRYIGYEKDEENYQLGLERLQG